jgi:ribonuclease Z
MTLHLLGTGAAVSDPHRTTTMLAVEAAERLVAVDCGGDLAQRMLTSGLDPAALDLLILTHEHPDHIAGFPLLLEKIWLMGRRTPLRIAGPAAALDVARRLFDQFDTSRWDGLPDRDYLPVELAGGVEVWTAGGLQITASPVTHPVPTIGLRFETGGAALAYSCDTAPDPAVAHLARGADVLVHEATGHQPGVHASAEEAAEIAREAGADRLYLVHLPPGLDDEDLSDARSTFPNTQLAEEGGRIEIG